MIVSDNGAQFTSQKFEEFCAKNNVVHVCSTPYHPKTNGLAERAVRTFKQRYTSARTKGEDAELTLQRFLISYRNTPQKSTSRAPAEIIYGRKLRTKLDLLKPDIGMKSDYSAIKQKMNHDHKAKARFFEEGEQVWVQRIQGKGYDAGGIVQKLSDYSYLVEVDGRVCRKHADQLKSKSTNGSDRENPPKGAHNDCHHRHHDLSGTETEPETCQDIPQDSSVDQAEPLQVEEDKMLGDVNVPDSPEGQEEERSPSGESSSLDEHFSQALPRRSSRLKKPVVRPYDQYLENPKAK